MSKRTHIIAVAVLLILVGCVGRTGKVGQPIAEAYKAQLASLELGESTPKDLQRVFPSSKLSLKEARIEDDKKIEIWEVHKKGNMDAAAFIMWGYVAYNKDQSLLFRFEDGKLASYESVVLPDSADDTSTTYESSPKVPETITYTNGTKYTGRLRDGKPDGTGTLTWATGAKYMGNWSAGKRTGSGTYMWVSGDRYAGQWLADKRNGIGTMVYTNGAIQAGVWRDDAYIGPTTNAAPVFAGEPRPSQ